MPIGRFDPTKSRVVTHQDDCACRSERSRNKCTCDSRVGGELVPYLAANGHLMTNLIDHIEISTGQPRAFTSATAWCAPNCGACAEGDPLPDY